MNFDKGTGQSQRSLLINDDSLALASSTSEQAQVLINWGVEGKHYVIENGKRVVPAPELLKPPLGGLFTFKF